MSEQTSRGGRQQPDPARLLSQFGPALAVIPRPATEIRRRGDRLRRRSQAGWAVAAVAVVALIATPFALIGNDSTRQAPPVNPVPTVTRVPDPQPSDGEKDTTGPAPLRQIPSAFPLAQGWPDPGGDGSVSGPSAGGRRLTLTACGRSVTAGAGQIDRLTTRWTFGNSEQVRELRLYDTQAQARRAADHLRELYDGCPSEDRGLPVPYVTTTQDGPFGAGSWQALSSFNNPAQPGESVALVVQLGNAVLIEVGNDEGSDVSRQAAEYADQLSAVRQAMVALVTGANSNGG